MQDIKAITEQIFRAHREGSLDLAETMYDQVLSQLTYPDPNILYGYGSLLVQKERFGVGVMLLQAAAKVYDKHAGIWSNLGVAYKYLGRDDLAIGAYEKAFALDPDAVEVLASMSGYYINRDESKKAEDFARRALINSDHPAAHMHLGLALLEQGRFDEAWPHYEHRWDTLENIKKRRAYASPVWKGEKVKKLIIHGEQGLGDEIFYMALFREAQKRADEIVVECATRLVEPFSKAFGVRCYGTETELKAAESPEDAHIAMASLPSVLGMPDGKAYMPRPHTENLGRPIIGIAWKGGVLRTNRAYRSLDLADFAPIFESIDATFVSVQYGGEEVDEEARKHGLDTGERGFTDLQYRIGICDLVITATQTAVYQAGAMGVPCWALVPRKTSWRYCGGAIEKFYNSVRLFRQPEHNDWESVISEVANKLKERHVAIAA